MKLSRRSFFKSLAISIAAVAIGKDLLVEDTITFNYKKYGFLKLEYDGYIIYYKNLPILNQLCGNKEQNFPLQSYRMYF